MIILGGRGQDATPKGPNANRYYASFIIIPIGATPPSIITNYRKPDRKMYERAYSTNIFFIFNHRPLPRYIAERLEEKVS